MILPWEEFFRFTRDAQLQDLGLPTRAIVDVYLNTASADLGDLHHLTFSAFWECLVRLALRVSAVHEAAGARERRAAYGHRRSTTAEEARAAGSRRRAADEARAADDGPQTSADKVRALLYFCWTLTSITVESEKAEAARVWHRPRTVDRSGLRAEPVRHKMLNKNLDLCVRRDRKIREHGSRQARRHLLR
jgi:hypothetical protein